MKNVRGGGGKFETIFMHCYANTKMVNVGKKGKQHYEAKLNCFTLK